MNPQIKGKAAVALIVSLIAFGFGTGASMFTDLNLYTPNNSSYTIKQPTDLPVVYNVKNSSNVNTTTTNPSTDQQSSSSSSQDVYQDNSQSSSSTPSKNTNQSSSTTCSTKTTT